jgi:hypothetical protein
VEEPSCFDAFCRKTLKRRNVVTREDALLTTTSPDTDEARRAAAVEVARSAGRDGVQHDNP